jgi:PAS domain S-box-containing protein
MATTVDRLPAGVAESMLAGSEDHLYLFDAAGRVVYVNAATAHYLDAASDAIVGCHWREVAWPDGRPMARLMADANRVRSTGREVTDREVSWEHLGERHFFRCSLRRIDADGAPYVMLASRDVTGMRRMEEERRRLLRGIVLAEELERQRIAGELHDDTIQVLAGCLLTVERVASSLAYEERAARDLLERLRGLLAACLVSTRRLMFDLRPLVLEYQGVGAALPELARVVLSAMDPAPGLTLELSPRRFALELEALAFRLCREAIGNAAKHSGARHVRVDLSVSDERIDATIADDGCGFDVERALLIRDEPADPNLGLRALVERARLVGGDARISSTPGGGATVAFWFPNRPSPAANTAGTP